MKIIRLDTKLKYQYINKFVFYYSDHSFHLNDTGLTRVEPSRLSKVMILARHHYIERVITLPITLTKDVKAAIEFEVEPLRDEFYIFQKILSCNNGKTNVIIWQVPKSIVPAGVMLVLPESYLLSFVIEVNQICLYKSAPTTKEVKLVKTADKISSTSSQMHSLDIFAQAIGVSTKDVIYLDEKQFLSSLLKAIQLSSTQLLTGFWLKETKESIDWQSLLKPFALPVSTFFIVYMILSSIFVSFRLSEVTDVIDEQKQEIDSVLTLQRDIQDLQADIVQYKTLTADSPPAWDMWQILAPLYHQGVSFKFIRFNGEQVFFSASAESASKVLEQLLNVETIISPQFSTAVRKSGGQESFIIKFTLAAKEVKNAE